MQAVGTDGDEVSSTSSPPHPRDKMNA